VVANECCEQTKHPQASAVLAPLYFVPEVILGLGLTFQEFGLGFKPYRQRASILPSKTLWRIPKMNEFPMLPLPSRRLSLPKIRFVRTGDAIRRGLNVRRCLRSVRSGACSGHPFQARREDATHYNRRRISQESAEGDLR
jgi:hypothetical protein